MMLENYIWNNIHQDGELIWFRGKIVVILMAVYLVVMGTIVIKKNISLEKNIRLHLIIGTLWTFLMIGFVSNLWLIASIASIIFYIWYRWCWK